MNKAEIPSQHLLSFQFFYDSYFFQNILSLTSSVQHFVILILALEYSATDSSFYTSQEKKQKYCDHMKVLDQKLEKRSAFVTRVQYQEKSNASL